MSIFDRIGTLAERLRDRVGREYGSCRTCGKPTRSHRLGSGVQCHVCYVGGEKVALADGGKLPLEDRVVRELEQNPNASVQEIAGALVESPSDVADVMDQDVAEPETGSDLAPENPLPDADFSSPRSTLFPGSMLTREQWMGHVDKKPYAPWGDKDAPAPCSKKEHPETAAECDCDARYKWGYEGHYVDGDAAKMAAVDKRLDGLAFILRKRDPFVFVDGDDVRDPETGEVHPAFKALIRHLGASYTDISMSGAGVHVIYRGELPENIKVANWEIDDSVWIGGGDPEDDLPEIEIYEKDRVCVMTGQHVPGTPEDAQPLDDDVLDTFLEANDQYPETKKPPSVEEQKEVDLSDYDPSATSSEETTDNIDDIYYALERLDARRVAEKTIVHAWNDDVGTSEGKRAFYPTWGIDSNGRANVVDRNIWDDTGGLGYGGPVVMAAIDAGIVGHDVQGSVRGRDWWEAVDHLRDLGFDIPEHEDPDDYQRDTDAPDMVQAAVEHGDVNPDPERVSMLPIQQLNALSPSERAEYAKRRGLEWPTTKEARERLFDTITESMEEEDYVVIDAPTSLGKSYSVAATRWDDMDEVTGGKTVVHLSKTRDARDEAREMAKESGIDYFTLRSRKEACPVASGDHDPRHVAEEGGQAITIGGQGASSWLDYVCDHKGIPFSVAHQYLGENNDQGVELPCCEGDRECLAITQWETLKEFDHDLILATHNFAHVPGLRMHKNIVVDEKPDFAQDLEQERVKKAVEAFLREVDAPVTTWEDFIGLARTDAWRSDAGREQEVLREAVEETPDREWYFLCDDAHTLAPALTRAICYAEERSNGRFVGRTPFEPPRLDAHAHDSKAWNQIWVTVVMDKDNHIRTIRSTPDFSQARSLIGLDAHPTMPDWTQNTSPYMDKKTVLEPEERRLWRRFERGLEVIQVGEATRPLTSGEYYNEGQVRTFAEALRDAHGSDWRTAITASSVEDRLQHEMEEAGVVNPETMHYGEEKSRNDFAGEKIGWVEGCIDPGDGHVLDLLAENNLNARPERADVCCEVCGDRENEPHKQGSGCPQCEQSGWARAPGRKFVGPDADEAHAILASVRENHTAQAAGRYARNPDDPDSRARVYVRTDASPPGFVDEVVPGVEWVFTGPQKDILEHVRDSPDGTTTREIAEAEDVSKDYARRVLKNAESHGTVRAYENAEKYGATRYVDKGVPDNGVVNVETTNPSVLDTCTWGVAISTPGSDQSGDEDEKDETTTEVWDWQAAANAPPPNESD